MKRSASRLIPIRKRRGVAMSGTVIYNNNCDFRPCSTRKKTPCLSLYIMFCDQQSFFHYTPLDIVHLIHNYVCDQPCAVCGVRTTSSIRHILQRDGRIVDLLAPLCEVHNQCSTCFQPFSTVSTTFVAKSMPYHRCPDRRECTPHCRLSLNATMPITVCTRCNDA